MSERQKLMCLLIKTVPLPFRTLKVIANKLVESGVKIPVRCKDCKHWRGCGEGCGWCEAWDGGRFHDNYCNYGERKK